MGSCENCGKRDWVPGYSNSGEQIVACVNCEIGYSRVPCDNGGALISGRWLGENLDDTRKAGGLRIFEWVKNVVFYGFSAPAN